jgi:DHA1 family multidrug resistance protein-like MFS transporter
VGDGPGAGLNHAQAAGGGHLGRLLALVGPIVFVDAMLFGALAPLLPRYTESLGLSKGGAGLLVAALGGGMLVGGFPAGMAARRLGSKRTTVIGLLLLAVASLAFGLAGSAWMLGLSRFVQGVASATTWAGALTWITSAAPPERRGEVIGAAFGAAVFGAIVGPMFGALAVTVGVRVSFGAVSAVAVLLAACAAGSKSFPIEAQTAGAFRRAVRDAGFLEALWLNSLPAVLFSVLSLLGPLALSRGGFGALAIGVTFFAAGIVEVVLNPLLGRLSDRVGRRAPTRLALGASVVVAALLAISSSPAVIVALVCAAGIAFGGLNTPGIANVSDRAEAAGLAQGVAFGALVLAWGAGNLAGPVTAGFLAEHGGDAVPYFAAGALCLLTLVASHTRRPV